MKTQKSNFLLGIAIGAAVGAAVAYVLTSGKKDEWLNTINDTVGEVKDKLEDILTKGKEEIETTVDKVNTSLYGLISRA